MSSENPEVGADAPSMGVEANPTQPPAATPRLDTPKVPQESDSPVPPPLNSEEGEAAPADEGNTQAAQTTEKNDPSATGDAEAPAGHNEADSRFSSQIIKENNHADSAKPSDDDSKEAENTAPQGEEPQPQQADVEAAPTHPSTLEKPAPHARSSGSGAKQAPTQPQSRPRRPSGREIILQANRDATLAIASTSLHNEGPLQTSRKSGGPQHQVMLSSGGFAYSTGPHLNGRQLTTEEEYTLFRRRNKVAPSFRGPVYVAEDVQVPCAACAGPLDPIARVPVGSLFFHATCVQCCICGLSSITENYSQVRDTTSAICAACVAKGFEPGVRKEIISAAQRQSGGHYHPPGTIGLNRQTTTGAYASYNPFTGGGASVFPPSGKLGGVSYNGASLYARLMPSQLHPSTALNQAVLPGATAPSLAIRPVHSRRNTSSRSFALMQRQQYYTQSDGNMIMSPGMVMPLSAEGPGAAVGQIEAAPAYGTASDRWQEAQPQLCQRRQSNASRKG